MKEKKQANFCIVCGEETDDSSDFCSDSCMYREYDDRHLFHVIESAIKELREDK